MPGNIDLNADQRAARVARFYDPFCTKLAEVLETQNPAAMITLRDELLSSFSDTLESLAMLDPFTVRGIIAQFWNQSRFDFMTLMARDTKGAVDAWRTSIVTALEDKGNKENPLDHKLVAFLILGAYGLKRARCPSRL